MTEQNTIKALWPIALAIGLHVQRWHTPERGGDAKYFHPHHWDGQSYLAAAFAEPGTIEYRLNQHADVRITDIDVTGVRPEDVMVGPIEPAGPKRVVRAEVLEHRNDTVDDVGWELEHRDLQAQTSADRVSKEVGASLAVGLRQQIGYGSEIAQISGETELTVNMEASVKAAWDREMTAHQEHEVKGKRDILVRAMHDSYLERVETVGPARQLIRAQGALKFGCRIHASGHWWVEWENLADFLALLQGIDATHKTNDGASWLPFYRAHPVPSAALAPFRQTVYAKSEKVREFEEASNIRVGIRSEPLTDEARLADALRLVALQAEDPELRRLAAAAVA